jgi:hypothetical protein
MSFGLWFITMNPGFIPSDDMIQEVMCASIIFTIYCFKKLEQMLQLLHVRSSVKCLDTHLVEALWNQGMSCSKE